MLLTQCAVCATELGLTLGKKCGRCSTRYCGPECQKQHWEEGGHDQLCKKVKRAGGAEQFYANTKYAEAVAVAEEACAADTKGQTCYICTQALHWKTKEGLVRMCACRGTAGFAHVSCLAEQAKILVAEAEENNLGVEKLQAAIDRWQTCSLCEQDYHGVVKCALGWSCWKTFVGRPETSGIRRNAMSLLGNGLAAAYHYEDALSVQEAQLSIMRRLGETANNLLIVQNNLATAYSRLGRQEEALRLKRDVYSGMLNLFGQENERTLVVGNNYATSLHRLLRFKEAKALLLKTIPVARRVFGEGNEITLKMRWHYARALYMDDGATLDDLREAVATLDDVGRTARQVFGGSHPFTKGIESELQNARVALRASALSSKATEDTCSRLREEIAQLEAENAKLRERRTRRRLG